MLHITNGDSVGLAQTGLPGEILFWRDALHDGPVPTGLPLRELSETRARFLAEIHGMELAVVMRQFAARDRTLEECARHEEVVLWFEHDLYDQLQLIQILDWFAGNAPGGVRLTLIQAADYLGPMPPERLAAMFPGRKKVTDPQLKAAASAWAAFCDADPRRLARMAIRPPRALPYLGEALLRHLEQFPSIENGLSRSEQQALAILASGPRRFEALFAEGQRWEERIFLGDSSFAAYLGALAGCRTPLIVLRGEMWALTEMGARVLAGERDHLELNGIDRWLGGVHLRDGEAWRWSDERRTVSV